MLQSALTDVMEVTMTKRINQLIYYNTVRTISCRSPPSHFIHQNTRAHENSASITINNLAEIC